MIAPFSPRPQGMVKGSGRKAALKQPGSKKGIAKALPDPHPAGTTAPADLETVLVLAGHSNLATTAIYLHSIDKVQVAAIDRLPGLAEGKVKDARAEAKSSGS